MSTNHCSKKKKYLHVAWYFWGNFLIQEICLPLPSFLGGRSSVILFFWQNTFLFSLFPFPFWWNIFLFSLLTSLHLFLFLAYFSHSFLLFTTNYVYTDTYLYKYKHLSIQVWICVYADINTSLYKYNISTYRYEQSFI